MDAVDPSGAPVSDERRFPCRACGALSRYTPGTASLRCEHCGATREIPRSADDIHELDFEAHLERLAGESEAVEVHVVSCDTCGAETTLDAGATAGACVYCGVDVVTQRTSRRLLQPAALLPFRIDREAARAAFRRWIEGLWFAPSALSRLTRTESPLTGLYVPYWTYDSDTTSWYTGQRGEHYWVTETYTRRVNGETRTETRQVRKTRWYPASGVVWNRFDDVLVVASTSLPRSYADALEPWDLDALVPYADDYLAGFRAESYSLGLAEGFQLAADRMDGAIHASVRRDIGGDVQRIHSVRTQHDEVRFKHLLLPIWLSTYRHRDRTYRFLVNGRTGETRGERPYSWVKIALAVLAALLLAGAVAFLLRG